MLPRSVVPSERVSYTMTEPYNAGLALHQLLEHGDGVFCVDNAALFDMCSWRGKQVRCHIYLFINLFIETGVCATSVLYCKNILSCATIHSHYFKL